MAAARQANTLADTYAGAPVQGGLLAKLLGGLVGGDQSAPPGAPMQLSGDVPVPDALPRSQLLDIMQAGDPAQSMLSAPGSSVTAKDVSAAKAVGAMPSFGAPSAPQPPQPSAASTPSLGTPGLPSLAALQGTPGGQAAASGLFGGVEQRFGLPAGYLAQTASIESGGNPNAVNKSSGAAGLFQFVPSTARQYGLGNPHDVVASTFAAGKLAADNSATLTQALGRPPTAGELYLAHQQGAGTAAALLANPNAPAGQVLASIGVNPRNIRSNGGDPNAPAGQFASLWTSKFGSGVGSGGPQQQAPASNGVAMLGGGAVPPLRGGGSPFGALDPNAFAQGGAAPGFPTFAAAGVGAQPFQATALAAQQPRSADPHGLAYAPDAPDTLSPRGPVPLPAGRPTRIGGISPGLLNVPTDAQGSALGANGQPTALGYDASTGVVGAPGQRAITAATSAPGTAPGTAVAGSPYAPQLQAPNPQAVAVQPSPTSVDTIRRLLSDPDTVEFGKTLWKSMAERKPPEYQHFETNDGSVLAFDPTTGRVAKIADGGSKPTVVGKALVNPATGGVIYDGNSPDTRTLTPAEYGRYGVPAGTPGPVQVDGEGKLVFPMKAGTNVQVSTDMRAEGAEAKGRGEGLAKRMNDIAEAGGKADEDAALFDRFGDLLNTVQTGARTAALEKVRQLTGVALDPNTDAVQGLNAAVQYLAPRLRVPGSGSQSDRELGNFLSSIPSLMGTPGGNARILNTLQGVTDYKRQRAAIADDWQLGNITAGEAQQRLNTLPSPFTRQASSQQQAAPQGGAPAAPAAPPGQGDRVQVRNAADFNALPSGTRFIDPNGTARIKP